MSISKKYLLQLITEEVNSYLLEQEDAAPEPEPADAGDDAGGDLDTGGDDLDVGGDDLGGDDLGGDTGGDLAGDDLGDDLEGGDDLGDDLGGDVGGGIAGGFGGGGGGDFDFGDESEPGLEAGEEQEEETASTVGPEDVETPEDPIASITDMAIGMLADTNKPQTIFNSVKAATQKYFGEFDDATPLIKALWDTEDLTLRDVASRLLRFIKGTTI